MKIDILGVKIDNLTINEVLNKIYSFLNSNNKYYIVTPNPEFIVQAQTDPEFRQILNYADIAVPDATGIIFASKMLGQGIKQRVTGADLAWKIIDLAESEGYSIFLLGGDPGIAAQAAVNIKKVFPKLIIAGADSGGIISDPKKIDPDLIKKINQTQPDILFVALGHGKQEKFIFYNLDKFKTVKVAIGIGGVLDYISGKIKRAPNWMRRFGLEWLYRLIRQPSRFNRIINAALVFPWLVVKSRFHFKHS